MGARPLIIDCDPGQDDAIALLMAIASAEEFDLLGVTAVAGNVPLSQNRGQRSPGKGPGRAARASRVCGLPEAHGACARDRRSCARPERDRRRRPARAEPPGRRDARGGLPGADTWRGVQAGDPRHTRAAHECRACDHQATRRSSTTWPRSWPWAARSGLATSRRRPNSISMPIRMRPMSSSRRACQSRWWGWTSPVRRSRRRRASRRSGHWGRRLHSPFVRHARVLRCTHYG